MATTDYLRACDDGNLMPWDEANSLLPIPTSQGASSSIDGSRLSQHWREARQKLTADIDQRNGIEGFDLNRHCTDDSDISSVDGCSVSDDWRRIGEARRKLILDVDRQNGGHDFDINKQCDVARYFQVAQRALEQFHKMYRGGGDLEEAYVMGHRMVSFLKDCLPTHPGYRLPSIAHLRKLCLWELDHLQICLNDLALTIDEVQCNKFAENFDPLAHVGNDDDSDSEDAEVSAAAAKGWADFGGSKCHHPQVESPTSTVATSGTSSLEAVDCCSSDDSMLERRIDFSDYEGDSHVGQSFLVELGTEFLDKVANEEVEYESDSEAVDSWAQDGDADSCASSLIVSQGEGLICDPARIAFQDLRRRATHHRPCSAITGEHHNGSLSSSKDGLCALRRPDPPVQVCRIHLLEDNVDYESRSCLENDRNIIRQSRWGLTVPCVSQRFLDASFEYDPSNVFDGSTEQFNSRRTCPSRRYTQASGPLPSSPADLPMALANKANAIFSADDGWVTFGSVRESVSVRSYRMRALSHQ